jgi:GalNAc-alpha-(1->4)-GalNAc-alpha-(1->3)-diNAcBac-PP-undecaprenol alpha-1,4-N-acetyl-D-galactosaminyltransferase
VRLAFIINDLSGGGAEKALTLLSGYLVDEGVEVRVITMQSGNDGYALAPGVERVTLQSGRLGHGVGKVLGLPVQASELARVIRDWQPDVCVSFLPRSNVAHVMTRWFGNRRPILLTEQISSRDNYPGSGVADRVMRALIGRFYPRADGVFPSSDGVKTGLVGFGVPPEKMHVVYNAISLPEIEASTRQPVDGIDFGDRPTIITVGRHAEQKDHETLLRAFAVVRQRLDARLVLLGQGPLRGDLEALARTLGVSDSVVFAGWQANPFAWLARADLFVLSSRFEGFGNVIVEAMACGLPVVSTDCPSGPREILLDGDAGLLVPVGDVAALADAMHSVLADRAVRDQLARKSQQRAPEFDISVIGPAYAALLRTYAGGRGARRV